MSQQWQPQYDPQQYPQQQGYEQQGYPPPQYPVQPYYPQQPMQVHPKSPAAALVISFFIPGVGSMYAGRAGHGGLILGLYVLSLIATVFVIGIFTAIGCWIWGMVAGYQDAQKWNRERGIIS